MAEGNAQPRPAAGGYAISSSFQRQLQQAEREAKRKGGVDTLDFLSRLELVESLDVQHDSAPSMEACGSAPPHYKGSPMKSAKGGKGGFMDDTLLLSTPAHGGSVKPPKAKKAKKGAAAKKKKKAP